MIVEFLGTIKDVCQGLCVTVQSLDTVKYVPNTIRYNGYIILWSSEDRNCSVERD